MNSALEDMRDIYRFIAADSPKFAQLTKDRIFELVKHLETFPKIGRNVPEFESDEFREIIYKNYRVIYQIKQDIIEILAIFHSSKNLTRKAIRQ
jgi:toxin ParE1/3/4